jgi:hypothetical protein
VSCGKTIARRQTLRAKACGLHWTEAMLILADLTDDYATAARDEAADNSFRASFCDSSFDLTYQSMLVSTLA